MSNIFPTDYTNKGSADTTDKVWASDGVANFNITVNEIGTKNFATRDTDNLTEGATNKYASTANVKNAGATMNTDTSIAGNAYFLDETGLTSNSTTKIPSQASVKAYIDSYTPADATTTTKGVVEKATATEVENGVLDKFPDALDIKNTYGQAGNFNGTSALFIDKIAHSGTLTISLGESNVKTVYMSGYTYTGEYNSPTWSKERYYFQGYFKVTTTSGIDFVPYNTSSLTGSDATDPSTQTTLSTLSVNVASSKSVSSIGTPGTLLVGKTALITGIYISGTDLKIDYSISAVSSSGQTSGIIIGPITIIN